jgi:hypothetical protein
MWTFDNFPTSRVNAAYGTRIDQAWLDRVRGASVRIPGCSASNVSPDGLVLTNHHCVVSCIQDLSTAQNDYVKNGWYTRTRAEEKQCPGMTAEILTAITDVTERVNRAGAGRTGADFIKARDAETGRIEQEGCGADTTVRCQVVSLYRGGQYKLYRYRKYNDVRLAFAPEFQAAFFGGDPDNFSFPRYALDAAFIRMYENGRPVSTPGYMRWNAQAPKAGDPVFVAGNPGSTNRLQTGRPAGDAARPRHPPPAARPFGAPRAPDPLLAGERGEPADRDRPAVRKREQLQELLRPHAVPGAAGLLHQQAPGGG